MLKKGNLHKIVAGCVVYLMTVGPVFSQAALVPDGKQQYFNNVGEPLNGGTATYYVPGTTNKKTTWQNSTQTTNNANPVVLDSAGRAVIYGQGSYRQVIKDSAGNTIWDAVTTAYGSSDPSGATGTDTAPVGTIMPFSGFSIPTNWELAYGQAVNRADEPTLLTALTITNTAVNCTSASATLTGFSDTSIIRVGAPIEATCLSTGVTVKSIVSSTSITVSSNANSTTTTTATIFPWGNGDGALTFNLPDLRGRTIVGPDGAGGTLASRLTATTTITTTSASATATVASAAGLFLGMVVVSANVPAGTTISAISGTTLTLSDNATASASGTAATFYAFTGANASGSSGGATSIVMVQSNLPTVTVTTNITDPGHAHATTNASRYAGTAFATGAAGSDFSVPINASSANLTGINTGSATTGITAATPLGGLNVPLRTLQPTIAVNYIIKMRTNTTGAGGVVSWGGLIGDIATDATLQGYIDGGVNYAGLADANNLTMLVNISGGTAQPLPATNTQWLDAACGSTHGMVIYRGSATWDCLAPPGAFKFLASSGGDPSWETAAGTGTVVSVGLALPVSVFSVSGSPVTSTGTLTGSFATQTANTFFAGPTSGAAAAPAFRALTGDDFPSATIPVASLVASATTVNGQTCTLGSTCTVTAAATDITVGTTTITGGTDTKVLFNNAGVLGEYTVSGTGNVAMTTSPVFTTPSLGVASATSINKVAITAPATSATLTIADGKTLTDTSAIGANLLLGATGGGFASYAGTSCTNQFPTALGTAGSFTCANVTNSYLSAGTFSSITGTGTLTAGAASTGFTIQASNVTWSGTVPAANLPTVADASGSPSATAGIMKCDGTTTTCSSGVVTAIGGAATDITVGTTTVSGGSNGNILYNNSGVLGEYAVASGANYLAGTASKILDAAVVYQAETTTTYSATPTFDFSGFYNTKITLTGNITSITCSNQKAGQSGTIRFIQDGSGSHTLPATFGCNFKFPGGVQPVLTTTANAIDAIVYSCSETNYCVASLLKNVQ